MERCDFSLVIRTIYDNLSINYKDSQVNFISNLFIEYALSKNKIITDKNNSKSNSNIEEYSFDEAMVCRWMGGNSSLTSDIVKYYSSNKNKLERAINNVVVPNVNDIFGLVRTLEGMLITDTTISIEKKNCLTTSLGKI